MTKQSTMIFIANVLSLFFILSASKTLHLVAGFVPGPGSINRCPSFQPTFGEKNRKIVVDMSTAMEQYLQDKVDAERDRREALVKRSYEEKIMKLLNVGEAEAEGGDHRFSQLLEKDFWRKMGPELSISDDPKMATLSAVYGPGKRNFAEDELTKQRTSLLDRGFANVPKSVLDWESIGVDMAAISDTIQRLKDDGWPPVFVFMYDEPWRMCEALFEVMGPIMDDAEVVLEASFYGWALDLPTDDTIQTKEKVGGNFGMPHRDSGYSESHTDNGDPSIVGIWIPTVDVNTENGCMYVVPRENDPLFEKSDDRAHLAPHTKNFPYQHIRPLPADAGTVLMWHHSTIHWGSACSKYATHPRKSIAMSFRLREERNPFTEEDMELYGRRPFTMEELSQGVDMNERLNMCSMALLMYSVWHPEFHGFSKDHLGVGTN